MYFPVTSPLEAPPLRPELIGYDSPPPPVKDGGLQPRRRPWVRFLFFVAMTIVVAIPCLVVGRALKLDALTASVIAQLIASVVAYVALLWFEKRLQRPIELEGRRAAAGLAVGFALGAALMSIVIGILWALQMWHFHGIDHDFTLKRAALSIFSVGVVAGVSEEIFFRGVLHRLVEQGLGTWGAVGVSGLIFGLMHLGNPQATLWGAIAIALEAGVLFGVLYSLTRSLWIMIGLHAAWNIVQGPIFGAVVSGSSERGHGFLRSSHSGPDLLTGGQFGPEASVVSVALLMLLAGWLAWRLHRSGKVIPPAWSTARKDAALAAAPQPPGSALS